MLDAALGEILTTCAKLDWLVTWGEHYLKPESRSTNWMLTYKSAKVYYEPLGVVAAIVSWNYRKQSSKLYQYLNLTNSSTSQCYIANFGCYIRWKFDCRQVFRVRSVVNHLVYWSSERVSTSLWPRSGYHSGSLLLNVSGCES